jgi:hypothetical protein
MANQKITELSEQASATNDDLLAIVDSPDTIPVTKKITKAAFLRGTGPESRAVLAANATVATSAMQNISGLSLSVSAGGIYRFNAHLMLNRTATSAITYGYGLTFPAMTNCRGTYFITTSTTQSALPTASVTGARIIFDGGASGSVLISTATIDKASAFAEIEAIMIPSADGVVQLQAKTSVAANIIIVLAGSYMEVVRLN